MQIILVQQEVEQALRDYVASRLTLVEGTCFEIDLAATRGVNGITATINLVQPGQAQAATQAAVAAPAASRKSTPEAPAKAQETAVTAQPDPNVPETPADPNQGQEAGQVTTETPAADPNQADPNVAGTEVPQTKSLFGGLTRPKNS